MYRHALPPGFVLKSEMKAALDQKNSNEVSLEMLVEKERASLGKTVTKVTLESFLKWKKRKIIEKKEEKVLGFLQVFSGLKRLFNLYASFCRLLLKQRSRLTLSSACTMASVDVICSRLIQLWLLMMTTVLTMVLITNYVKVMTMRMH